MVYPFDDPKKQTYIIESYIQGFVEIIETESANKNIKLIIKSFKKEMDNYIFFLEKGLSRYKDYIEELVLESGEDVPDYEQDLRDEIGEDWDLFQGNID